MKEEGQKKKYVFLALQTQERISRHLGKRLWVSPEAGRGRRRLAPCESPSPFARRGRRQRAPALCPRPPRGSQSISSCSGHSLLMIEMFDWAKFPTRMLHDSILSKALAAAHGRSAFIYSSLQSFAHPFLGLFQKTTKRKGLHSSNGATPRQHRVAARSYSGAVYSLI